MTVACLTLETERLKEERFKQWLLSIWKAQSTAWISEEQKRRILGGSRVLGCKLHPVYSFITLALSPGKKRNGLSSPAVFTCPLHSGCLIQSEPPVLAFGGMYTVSLPVLRWEAASPYFIFRLYSQDTDRYHFLPWKREAPGFAPICRVLRCW